MDCLTLLLAEPCQQAARSYKELLLEQYIEPVVQEPVPQDTGKYWHQLAAVQAFVALQLVALEFVAPGLGPLKQHVAQ